MTRLDLIQGSTHGLAHEPFSAVSHDRFPDFFAHREADAEVVSGAAIHVKDDQWARRGAAAISSLFELP